MGKIIVKAWITLDGVYDATSMGEWFNPFHNEERAEAITQNLVESDAMLYGRNTYDMLMPYWSKLKNNEMGIADKLNSVPKYIVSAHLQQAEWNNSTVISENFTEEIGKLKDTHEQIMIDGSATLVQSLMNTDLIDEYRLLVHPVVMGSGKHFFKDGMPVTKMKLLQSKTFSTGVMLQHYGVSR